MDYLQKTSPTHKDFWLCYEFEILTEPGIVTIGLKIQLFLHVLFHGTVMMNHGK